MRVNQALCAPGLWLMLHLDAVRSEVDPYAGQRTDNFPDRISKAIDEGVASSLAGQSSLAAVRSCVSYLPPHTAVKSRLNLSMRTIDVRASSVRGKNTLSMFERELSNLENGCPAAFPFVGSGLEKITEDGREVA